MRDGEYDVTESSICDDQEWDGKHDGTFWNAYPRKGDKDSAGDHVPVRARAFLCSSSYGTPGRNVVLPPGARAVRAPGLKKRASQTAEHTAAVSISSEVEYGLSK
jgi:hypothetical protein